MSSLYSADKLTAKVMKTMLAMLREAGGLTADKMLEDVRNKFAKHFNDKPNEINRILNEAVRSDYIQRSGRASRANLTITDKGLDRLQHLKYHEDFERIKNTKWDGKWRALSYDIPETDRLARNAIRRLIRQVGFRQLHRSVWVIPYDCKQQILDIQTAYGIEKDISLLVVEDFDRSDEFKRAFNLL